MTATDELRFGVLLGAGASRHHQMPLVSHIDDALRKGRSLEFDATGWLRTAEAPIPWRGQTIAYGDVAAASYDQLRKMSLASRALDRFWSIAEREAGRALTFEDMWDVVEFREPPFDDVEATLDLLRTECPDLVAEHPSADDEIKWHEACEHNAEHASALKALEDDDPTVAAMTLDEFRAMKVSKIPELRARRVYAQTQDLFSDMARYIRDGFDWLLPASDEYEPSKRCAIPLVDDVLATARCDAIATLNQDTILERGFDRDAVPYDCGFNDAEHLTPDTARALIADRQAGTVAILKLHGSVDWFRPYGRGDRIFRSSVDQAYNDTNSNFTPEVLIGKLAKKDRYLRSVWASLQSAWGDLLDAIDVLVCCGYSFGDDGINQAIVTWLEGSPERRLLVANPAGQDVFDGAAEPSRSRFQEFVSAGQVSAKRGTDSTSRLADL